MSQMGSTPRVLVRIASVALAPVVCRYADR